ncbi:MAG: hypothetical protein ACYC22_10695 [Thiomonas delicata]
MKAWTRHLLIVMLILLPLRGWTQAVMAGTMDMPQASCASMSMDADPAASMTHAHEAMQMPAADPGPAHQACADHEHQLCVVCNMAAASVPALFLPQSGQVQAPRPAAACTSWDSADLRALLRPPRL